MKVVLAFDSYKGAISASQACDAAAKGIRRAVPDADIITCPLSDGGEGFASCIKIAGAGEGQPVVVTGPLFEKVQAEIVRLDGGKTAVLEAAQACGLGLVPDAQRSPLHTTTYGLGEMIRQAIETGAKQLVIGIGGSSTNDAGIGMLAALGWKFFDGEGQLLQPVGASLLHIQSIEPGESYPDIAFTAACDVTNPLFGPRGAAYTFGLQKGASPEDVEELDRGLRHFAEICTATFGQNLAANPGAGAAGGLGYALQMFLHAAFQPGAELAIQLSRLPQNLKSADLCLTGEGQTDFQTAYGKLPAAVNAASHDAGVPCVCLSGALGHDWRKLYEAGFTAIFSICQGPASLQEAIANSETGIADAAEAVIRLLR